MTTRLETDRIEPPSDLAEAFRQVGNRDDPPETLREGFAIIEETLDEAGVDVSIDDMYQSEPTRHAVSTDETTEHVPCVLDALIVSLALDTEPIEIHSEPPGGGETVQFRVTGQELTVTPESAVVSFGIGCEEAGTMDVEKVDEQLNEASTIPTTCSVINAFPDSDAYDQWARDVSEAAVMELEVDQLVALAQQASEGYTSD